MNFLDPYDITNSTTPQDNQPQQSLEEEVNQVIGQLGGFWGRIRKQGQAALQTARKDLGGVVVQAQKEFGKLTTTEPAGVASTSESVGDNAVRDTTNEGASTSTPPGELPDATTPPASSSSSQTLLSRFQAALPPNIVSTLQNNIPDSLKHASENIDFSQLRTTLSSEFQRVQGVTRTQAEDYVKKTEAMLRETMKEAQEVLKDAVKIIPPEDGTISASSSSGLVWDGSDMWMLPSEPSDFAVDSKGKGKDIGPSSSSGSLGDVQRVATRAESLLKRLNRDPEIIKHEPDATQLNDWLTKEVDTKEGGIDSDYWKARIVEAQDDVGDGAALLATHDELVPSVMDKATFWKRYFFRVHQIRLEEEKRKALLQGAVEQEEDFSWEDDDDEASSPTADRKSTTVDGSPSSAEQTTPTPTGHLKDSSKDTNISSPQVLTPAGTSPRESEDGSYDVVSSSNVSAAGEKPSEDSDADSDWE